MLEVTKLNYSNYFISIIIIVLLIAIPYFATKLNTSNDIKVTCKALGYKGAYLDEFKGWYCYDDQETVKFIEVVFKHQLQPKEERLNFIEDCNNKNGTILYLNNTALKGWGCLIE